MSRRALTLLLGALPLLIAPMTLAKGNPYAPREAAPAKKSTRAASKKKKKPQRTASKKKRTPRKGVRAAGRDTPVIGKKAVRTKPLPRVASRRPDSGRRRHHRHHHGHTHGHGGGGGRGKTSTLSGGLLVGGVGGSTALDAREVETGVGPFVDLTVRGEVAPRWSVGGYFGFTNTPVVTSGGPESITTGQVGLDVAMHMCRRGSCPYVHGGAGYAGIDLVDPRAEEDLDGGWYWKAGAGTSVNIFLVEATCGQYFFKKAIFDGRRFHDNTLFRCGLGVGLGR